MEVLETSEIGVSAAAQEAADVLSRGGIVLFPTDTLYGLAVDVRDAAAVARLIALKGRDVGKAISVILPSASEIGNYADVSDKARRLIEKHLPGPLTLVLPIKNKDLLYLAADGTIGIRVPNDPFTLELGGAFNAPYTATSANVSGKSTLSSIPEILTQFGASANMIDLVIDAGPRVGGVGSTVVRVIGEEIEILREGALTASDLGL